MADSLPKTDSLRRFFGRSIIACLLLVRFVTPNASGQDPVINRIDCAGWVPGTTVTATVRGSSLQSALALWTPLGVLRPVEGSDLSKDQPVSFSGALSADAVPGIYPARMVTSHGVSESSWIVVEDLPVVALTGAADARDPGQELTLPCAVSGHLTAVTSRFFRVQLEAGQTLSGEVYARRLGSSLDPVLRLLGPDGGEVLYSDDQPGAEGDSGFLWIAKQAGSHLLELRDVRYSGGERHHFHLRLAHAALEINAVHPVIGTGQSAAVVLQNGTAAGDAVVAASAGHELVPVSSPIPDAQGSRITAVVVVDGLVAAEQEPNQTAETATPISADAVALAGGFSEAGDEDWFRLSAAGAGKLLLTARTRDAGSPADLVVTLFDAAGKQLAESDDTGPRDAEIEFAVPAAGDYLVRVRELAGRGGAAWTYAVDLTLDRGTVVVTTPADRLNIPRGGSSSGVLTIRRVGYGGPLKLEAVQLPAGLTMQPIVVGSRQSAVPLTLTATGSGDVTDADWGTFRVRISAPDNDAVQQTLQLVPPPPPKNADAPFRSRRTRGDFFAGAAPGLEFSLRTEPTVLKVAQGETVSIKVLATRSEGWTVPVEVSLAAPADQLNPGVTVTAGSMAENELEVKIAAAADAGPGPCVVFLQGKSKKDKTERILPVPPIQIEVTEKAAGEATAEEQPAQQ